MLARLDTTKPTDMAPDGYREGAREREMHRYYQPWLDTFMSTRDLHPVAQLPPEKTYRPRSSRDKALTAFAQLGCLRLRAKRGIVTLLDAKKQYIIAEATQSLSLLSDSQHATGDELWFGNSFIQRDSGVSGDAMFPDTYTAHGPNGYTYSAPALVIGDMTKHEKYWTRGYAGNGVSFYCGVPITTRQGYVIGVYTVSDDEPRDRLQADELRFMVDMAVIVAQHLETVKGDQARVRGERLIQGIGTFIVGPASDGNKQPGPNFAPQQPSAFTSSETKTGLDDVKEPVPDESDKPSKFKGMVIGDANEASEERKHQMGQAVQSEVQNHFIDTPEAPKNSIPAAHNGEQKVDKNSRQRRPSGPPRAKSGTGKTMTDAQDAFDRAASILRDCIKADGVVFLDASSANLSSGSAMNDSEPGVHTMQHTRNKGRRLIELKEGIEPQIPFGPEPNGVIGLHDDSDSNSSTTARSASDSSTTTPKKDFCDVLGVSVSKPTKALNITLQRISRFVRHHPTGKCFVFDSHGRPASSDDSSGSGLPSDENSLQPVNTPSSTAVRQVSTTRALAKVLPDARNIVFLPLWDYAKDRWHAAVVLWSNDPHTLTNIQDDMAYLVAFNNAVINEINRINLALSDTAKATFLANISHELRSPLHGILGSIEFLHDTAMDDFQAGMVISVETCGKTLLDTVNHVLDYAKINNLSGRTSRKTGSTRNQGYQQATNSDDSLTVDFDMALIVEEAVEAVYAGQVFRTANGDALQGKGPTQSAAGRAMEKRQDARSNISEASAIASNKVRLTLNIDDHTNWNVRSQPGAVRRLVMNILGNALKYTSEGSIDVSLEIDRSRKKRHSHVHALLRVTDTGRGMSGDFMKNHAFTAFAQEDSLATGTGLGLSIVRQIVDALGGKIDLASEKDRGTEISTWLSLPRSQAAPPQDFEKNIMTEMRSRTKGLDISLLLPQLEKQNNGSQVQPLREMPSVESSMRNLLSQWFSMKVTTDDSMEGRSPHFFLYPEPPPIDFLMHNHGKPNAEREIPVIVLCTNAFEAASLRTHGLHRLTDIGRIIEIISQPCGPHKLAKVLHRCMQRMDLLQDQGRSKSWEHVSLSLNRKKDKSSRMFSRDANLSQGESDDELDGVEGFSKSRDNSRVSLSSQKPAQQEFESSESIDPAVASAEHVQGNDFADKSKSTGEEKNANSSQMDGKAEGQVSPKANDVPVDQRPRVLVVDDNHINLHLLITFVRKTNHPHESATDGLKALEAYERSVLEEKNGFKYILMDISMPVMNGIVSTREIRQFEKENNIRDPVEIIALTGLGSESAQNEAYQAGFDHFLSKPIVSSPSL
ncbi:hypothetical protein, variant [Exophiala oligosperma]|uniref:Histidine kinase n=1 Tax=Exophiala oligosperma TaxID=215243 RepID=A0A0D2DV86_9EURO|nr:hypothetical protein, variant [Exophiala oligosperma]KIW47008.1 hypothetical protein, variant [Exophiala oligosperma]